MYEVFVEKKITCSHALRHYRGSNEPPHKHAWVVRAAFSGKKLAQPTGILVDFKTVRHVLDKILGPLDGKNANKVFPFDKMNPSAENVARWIYNEYRRLSPGETPSSVT